MKTMHFCTPEKIKEIKDHDRFDTIRTGWIPQVYPGDVIAISEVRPLLPDRFLFKAKVISVEPWHHHELDHGKYKEEINRYKRKFHPEQYFFKICFKKMKTLL